MIAVIDYGMGNLGSVSKALESFGGKVKITRDPSDLRRAKKIVLPGVGAFGDAMDALSDLNMTGPLKEELNSGKPYLGICLGLQVLFEKSAEGGASEGLGVLKGEAVRFSPVSRGVKVPHIGWNRLEIKNKDCPLLKDIADGAFFYFIHSYYVRPGARDIISCVTDYGGEFTSMIWSNGIYAVQFHPEKSQGNGLKLLENFIKL